VPGECPVELPVRYKGLGLDCGYRIDVVVEDTVIVELKSLNRSRRSTMLSC
jgi:GxxExxY protein